ncbi:NADH dehydrogenase [ubiquinone] 1 beta subcomplex subunit 5, mitochondrial [Coccinella septempunctata]|uniref:NADH dehydrogenase [ubiquinone] 1 beta subcomplex subunit 5, mitochondrial n=1 Tax=Coccinella septempunctata TaxID=41139 RepID=UPI001D092968|nr:NADH dehydrogenase [ubiquinone] 1 beta subcomplex subunit 5, mitochondrial [Coccinella septempunctata]
MILSTLKNVGQLTKRIVKSPMTQRTMSEHREFPLLPSKYTWTKFKDLVHFYVMLGVIPSTLVITYCNVFIGPATLSEIPEDYTPKYWEYHRHPITRFIAKYLTANPQQEYEKYLAHLYIEDEKRCIRKLEEKIKLKMKERDDYQAYYYRPVLAKYHRRVKQASDYIESIQGD